MRFPQGLNPNDTFLLDVVWKLDTADATRVHEVVAWMDSWWYADREWTQMIRAPLPDRVLRLGDYFPAPPRTLVPPPRPGFGLTFTVREGKIVSMWKGWVMEAFGFAMQARFNYVRRPLFAATRRIDAPIPRFGSP